MMLYPEGPGDPRAKFPGLEWAYDQVGPGAWRYYEILTTIRSKLGITKMSTWQRSHLSETLKALATSDNGRFFVRLREPHGESRNPIEFYRWTLADARNAADRLVQAYYPHDCDENSCGKWFKLDLSD